MADLHNLLCDTHAAVMVIDMQNDYCHPDGALAKNGANVSGVDEIVPNVQRLLEAAELYEKPVLFVQTIHTDATDSEVWKMRASGKMRQVCRPGTWGAEYYGVSPKSTDIIVRKHKYSGFINTFLDSVLRAQKIETLLIAGVSTNVCVESTARDAFMLDYRVVLLQNGCASYERAAHEMTLENIGQYFGTVAYVDDVITIWKQEAEQTVQVQSSVQ